MRSCPTCGRQWPDDVSVCGVDKTPLRDEMDGRVVGHYRIVGRLGSGGMGTVYVGEHLGLHRKDAIKILNRSMASDPDALARFHREARNASTISHENVCRVYDFGETEDGLSFLVMELVEGESLSDLLARHGEGLDPERAVRIIRSAAEGLQAAHDRGIVHRDLKPGNIMVGPRHGGDTVKVVDFGIAKSAAGGAEQEVTRVGMVAGTPEYMSPEHLRGEEPDPRSDVYSLGVVLYRALTGRLPFTRETPGPIPTPLSQVRPTAVFPSGLEEITARALALDPTRRFPSARELGAALERIGQVGPRPTRVVPDSGPRRGVSRGIWYGAGAAGVVATAGIAWVLLAGAGTASLVSVDPRDLELVSGEAAALVAGWSTDGQPPAGGVLWTSDDDAVAVVDGSGRVRGARVGTVLVRAVSGPDTALARVTVVPGPPARVDVAPVVVGVGGTEAARAAVSDAVGNETAAALSWSVDATSVADVDPSTGVVRGLGAGTATISARAVGASGASAEGHATVTVRAGSRQPIDPGGGRAPTVRRISIEPAAAPAVLEGLYRTTVSAPSDPAVQRAVRDSAQAIYDLGSRISDPVRGAAAWVISNMLIWMGGDPADVDLWKRRADALDAAEFIAGIGDP